MKVNHQIEIELLTRNTELYIEAREDKNYSSVVTAGWYRELQLLMKSVSQYEGTIRNVPVLLHTAGDDKITDTNVTKAWLMSSKTNGVSI